jgi:hypothetical protein
VRQRLLGEGQRQQVIGMDAAHRAPAQVVGHQRGFQHVDELVQAREVRLAQGIDGADRQAHAVQAQRMALARELQEVQRLAAPAEVVLAVGLDEAHGRTRFDELDIVPGPQADAGTPRQGSQGLVHRHLLGHSNSRQPPAALRHA